MPELRQNRFTKEWVIMATERAKRPEELRALRAPHPPLPHYSATCPFCPGNEHMAPPAVLVIPAEEHWQVRVVPNKFPALAREGELTRKIERSRRSLNGVGIHDVIVETPDHALTTALLPVDHVAEVLRCFRRRFTEVSADPRIAHITIFKNNGVAAGTSLEHPHAQLIGTPVISSQVRHRVYEALRHYDEFGECIFCEALKEDLEDPERIVLATNCLSPSSRSPPLLRSRPTFIRAVIWPASAISLPPKSSTSPACSSPCSPSCTSDCRTRISTTPSAPRPTRTPASSTTTGTSASFRA